MHGPPIDVSEQHKIRNFFRMAPDRGAVPAGLLRGHLRPRSGRQQGPLLQVL